MARRLGRAVVTCLITASLVGATGASASAERWWSGDRSGDVGQIAFSPEPPPCGTVTESVTPQDAATDIVGLSVRHERGTVDVRAHFRDLTAWGDRHVSFDLATDRGSDQISMMKWSRRGPVETSLLEAAPPPESFDECGGYATVQLHVPCDVVVTRSPAQDYVSVVLPRSGRRPRLGAGRRPHVPDGEGTPPDGTCGRTRTRWRRTPVPSDHACTATEDSPGQGGHPVAQQRGAGVAGLLRVELGRRQRTVLDGGDEPVAAVLGPGHQRRPGAVVGLQRPVAHAVGVHEVEPLALDAGEQRGARRATSTVFQPMCGTTGACSRSTTPGHSSQPSVSTPCSTPRSNRICMPTQMPSTGRPPASRRPMTSWPRTRRSPAMHAAKAPTPGTTRPSASCAGCRSAVRVTVGAGALEGAHGRAEVARPVVEDDDAYCHRASPLVRGHAGLARVDRDRVAERPGERLELRLDEVVRVAARTAPARAGRSGRGRRASRRRAGSASRGTACRR